ncbi:peroxisomal sarcosine oxidase-like [Gigantopelta aegis]|uniref:peroxisomal sarcosine oxidase-like n=1 Tax=Gigantopelta aegis TaxID=1735272 RepID=UPI001B8878BE|nr:peroxisomal sarcosine oxidase-like [Gigantopelta aegis]XP_041348161.1 peroxisomal sarcosine oxidase-like [Gigantopelta aegis]
MAHNIYDVVVVGAGIEGSATANYLAKQGVKTLLLEQFPLPHSRGSSHGQSRITRKAYPEVFYTKMMLEATDMWLELQNNFGCEIFRQSGFVSMGEYDGDVLMAVTQSLLQLNTSHQVLTPSEFKTRFPMMKYPETFAGVLDFDGGLLRADKALQAFQSEFTRHGGVIMDGCKVINIKPGLVVAIETPNAIFRGRKLVITAGPWASAVLKPLELDLPLKPVRISVCYWKERECGSHSSGKLLPFYDVNGSAPYDIYGLPCEEYPGHVKICLHHGPEIDPDNRDGVPDSWVLDLITKYVRDHFPGLETCSPSIVETCIYTNTPDKHPILDKHPRWKNIIIGAGFSGHGFKLSPVVGKILGQFALGETPSYDVTPFRIDRFKALSRL